VKKFDELKENFDRGINVQTLIVVHDIKLDVHDIKLDVHDMKDDVHQLGSTLDTLSSSGRVRSLYVIYFPNRLKH